MLLDNPLLTFLGRSGRAAVVDTMRRAPSRTWTVRDLALFAMVDPMTASRSVKELVALGAATVQRPGRDARVRFEPGSPAGAWLASLVIPDLHAATGQVFAAAFPRPPGFFRLVRWRHPADKPGAPSTPVRIGIIVARDEAAALEAAGPALDAVRAAGLPGPDVAAFARASLDPRDPVAAAVLGGFTL